jgi:hypothetical protein
MAFVVAACDPSALTHREMAPTRRDRHPPIQDRFTDEQNGLRFRRAVGIALPFRR